MTEGDLNPTSSNVRAVAPMRRVVHVSLGGGLAAGALLASIPWVRAGFAVLVLGFVFLDVARLISPQINHYVLRWFQPLMKPSESSKRVTGVSDMLMAVRYACWFSRGMLRTPPFCSRRLATLPPVWLAGAVAGEG